MYSYKTGLGQVWVGAKLPPNPGSNIIWLRPSDDHRVLWEIRTYNIYKEEWEVLTSAALTAEGLLKLIYELEKRVDSLEELKVVLYDRVQSLTDDEKKTARENIGALGEEDLPEIVQEPGSDQKSVMSQDAVTKYTKTAVDNNLLAAKQYTDVIVRGHNTSTTAHADIRELLNTCVGLPAYDSSSYKITFTTLAGASVEIDLPIEQLALRYNAETESIEFDNADGTTTSIPVSAFVKEYVGSIGDQIQVSIDTNNVIHGTVLKNSIDWDSLSLALQERINSHISAEEFATQAVRTDIEQTLSIEAQNQALENIGADLMVIDLVNGQAVLTEEQEARLLSCKGVILRGTTNSPEVLSCIFHMDNSSGNIVAFYSFRNGSFYLTCQYTKSTRTFGVVGNSAIRDNSAVVFNRKQSLTTSQQAQAFANLGWKVHVISESVIGSSDAVSDNEKSARLSATALLVQETGEMYIYGHNSSSTPSDRRFYRFRDTKTLALLNVVTTTGLITQPLFVNIYDENAVSFNIDQSNVSNDRKNKALSNIGLNFVRIDYSVIGTTLDDQLFNQIANAKGVIVNNHPDGLCVYTRARGTNFPVLFFSLRDATTVSSLGLSNTYKTLANAGTFGFSANCVYYINQVLTDTQKQQARSNIDAVGSSGIKGVEIVYSTAPMQQDNILYIELEETT